MKQRPKGFFVRHFGLRGIAVLEAGKGVLALAFGIWVLTLVHKDMSTVAQQLLEALHRFFHLNPDTRFYQWLLNEVGGATRKSLGTTFSLALAYMTVRFVEATGLWLEKEWAEWFALVSGSIYIPWELYELVRHPTWIKWGILVVNLLIVVYLAWLLRDSYQRRKALQELDV